MAKKALEENNPAGFLDAVTRSQESSCCMLANTMVPCQYEKSPQQGVDIAKRYIGLGAVRIMGGGFAGSIICFVPKQNNNVKEFIGAMAHHYGEDAVKEVHICPQGPVELA